MSAYLLPTSDRAPEVVDLTAVREARQPQSASWFCPSCDLVAAGFTPTECAYLAHIHDQVQHGSRTTAQIQLGGATPLPPADGLGIGA